jgi:hypothetical protein
MTQNILVIAADDVVADYISMAQQNDCVGILRGIPPNLSAQAESEGWVLPHVYIESLPSEPDPSPGGV